MTVDLYAHAVWTIRVVVVLAALAAAVSAVSFVQHQLERSASASTATSFHVANGRRDVVTCDAKRTVAYVDRLDVAKNCDAVVLHVADPGYLRR